MRKCASLCRLPATRIGLAQLQQEAVHLNANLRLDQGGRLCAKGGMDLKKRYGVMCNLEVNAALTPQM
jgi:hypothetical protein